MQLFDAKLFQLDEQVLLRGELVELIFLELLASFLLLLQLVDLRQLLLERLDLLLDRVLLGESRLYPQILVGLLVVVVQLRLEIGRFVRSAQMRRHICFSYTIPANYNGYNCKNTTTKTTKVVFYTL